MLFLYSVNYVLISPVQVYFGDNWFFSSLLSISLHNMSCVQLPANVDSTASAIVNAGQTVTAPALLLSKPAAFFDANDSESDSDASSDILQPTQVKAKSSFLLCCHVHHW
jgi:hypothetical protein